MILQSRDKTKRVPANVTERPVRFILCVKAPVAELCSQREKKSCLENFDENCNDNHRFYKMHTFYRKSLRPVCWQNDISLVSTIWPHLENKINL